MRKLIFSVVVAAASAAVLADASIERVLVRQQWPWDEKVAIDFVLTNVTSATAIDCAVYRGDTRVNVSPGAFSGNSSSSYLKTSRLILSSAPFILFKCWILS